MSPDDPNAGDGPSAPDHDGGGPRTEAAAGSARRRSRWPLPRLILLLGGLALAFGLGASLWRDLQRPASAPAAGTGVAAVGGPFMLIDQDGRPVDETILKGKWSAVFFGYTYCPDVCPATLTALKVAKDRVGAKARDLQVIFVTVDPERDTPAQLKSYLSSPAFPQPVVGLTGSPEQIAAVAKAYKVYYRKVGTGDDYLMDHASQVYLMDPQGRFHSLVSTAEGLDSMAESIGDAIGRS